MRCAHRAPPSSRQLHDLGAEWGVGFVLDHKASLGNRHCGGVPPLCADSGSWSVACGCGRAARGRGGAPAGCRRGPQPANPRVYLPMHGVPLHYRNPSQSQLLALSCVRVCMMRASQRPHAKPLAVHPADAPALPRGAVRAGCSREFPPQVPALGGGRRWREGQGTMNALPQHPPQHPVLDATLPAPTPPPHPPTHTPLSSFSSNARR